MAAPPRSLPPARRRRRTTLLLVAAGSAVLLLLLALPALRDAVSSTAPAAGPGGAVGQGVTLIPVAERRAAPALSGTDLDGHALDLAGYRGSVVVINVWGSWCGPCRAEADGLEQAFRATGGEGVRFLGLDTRDIDPAAPRTFVREHHIDYPSLHDPSGTMVLRFPPGTLNPQAIPATLLLDRAGRIAGRVLGPVTEEQLCSAVRSVTGEAS
ncbi:TlpA disulfide reductase family protein [Kitasatospora nipponensis]|uniref:TlpA disulfide reductase family protein n=1 Tax=Kitasatospora nipponensis TaxID=258049 RepID=A0ABN1X3V4_9ACTN